MVSTCKPLQAPSSTNKPKVLIGLDQKVCGQVRAMASHPAQMSRHRCRGGA